MIKKNNSEKKIIDLRVINEGLFSHLLAAISGWVLGRSPLNTKIKGQKDQIEILKKYLEALKKSNADKDALVSKLMTIQ
jgi:hypothetical protein